MWKRLRERRTSFPFNAAIGYWVGIARVAGVQQRFQGLCLNVRGRLSLFGRSAAVGSVNDNVTANQTRNYDIGQYNSRLAESLNFRSTEIELFVIHPPKD